MDTTSLADFLCDKCTCTPSFGQYSTANTILRLTGFNIGSILWVIIGTISFWILSSSKAVSCFLRSALGAVLCV